MLILDAHFFFFKQIQFYLNVFSWWSEPLSPQFSCLKLSKLV